MYTYTTNIDEDAIQALLDKGAKSVRFYAVARTVGDHNFTDTEIDIFDEDLARLFVYIENGYGLERLEEVMGLPMESIVSGIKRIANEIGYDFIKKLEPSSQIMEEVLTLVEEENIGSIQEGIEYLKTFGGTDEYIECVQALIFIDYET